MHHAAKYIPLFSEAHTTSKRILLLGGFLLNIPMRAKLAAINDKFERPITYCSELRNMTKNYFQHHRALSLAQKSSSNKLVRFDFEIDLCWGLI